jgi:GNAT superfamily N-acetyltransferase
MVPQSMLNWGKRVSDKLKEDEVPVPTGSPLTPEEEQQIADELDDDPIFTKEENALLRKAKKEAEEKRKQDEADLADAQKIAEIQTEKDPSKLKQYKEEGVPLDKEQEKIAWKYERDMPATRKVGDFMRRAGKGLEDIATDIPVGIYKGVKYGVFDPIGAMDASPEEEAKALKKAEQVARSFGSGAVGGIEDIVYKLPKTVYKGGTPITDWAKELVGAQTEEESYQNYLKRKAVGEEFAKEQERMPERSSALLENVSLGLGKIGALDKTFSEGLAQQFRERALTKEQLIPEVATLGDIVAPDIPLMNRVAPLTAKATGKIGEVALKGLTGVQVGNRRIGVAPAVEKVGWAGRRLGEKINEYSANIDRAISGSDDWIFRNAVGKTSNFLGRGSGLIEGVGRFGTDIGRVIDTGIAGRKGIAERLGQSPTTGRLGNVLFGDGSQGLRKKLGEMSPVEAAAEAEKAAEKMEKGARQGLARARAVDSASRLAQYYAKAGINGAAVQVMLGLPNMETWGDVGEATGYGGGMGFISASSPKSLLVDRVRADQRVAAEADINRMMQDLDDSTKDKLKSLADPVNFVNQLNKRKEVVDSRLGLLKDIVNSAKKRTIGNTTITPRDAQAEIDHIENEILPKINSSITSASKTDPKTQKEIEFIINKEFMDSLGNLKAVADQSGIGGDIDVRMLSTDEIKAAIDEMYAGQKQAADEVIKTLGGQENLSPEDKKLVDDAIAFQEFLETEKENNSSQRGFALTPARERTQTGWWQGGGAPVNKPTIIINSDDLKNSRGLDLSSVMRHEMFHGLLQFSEVQDMMKEYTDVLFDQYTTDAEGNQEKFSDGIISDEKLRQMADKYSAKYNPLEKGMWRSMFETDADLLNAIKEEFLAETFTQSGGASGMTSNVEDSVVETVLDYARAQNSSSALGRIRDSLGKFGISIDDSGRSNVLESEIPSQAIALMRQFRRTLRDYNGTLNQIGQAELNAPGAIPITKIASSKALFNRYKDADFWEREAATTITAPDGTVISEEVLPKSAQAKLVAGEWTVQNGKLVPVDPEYSSVAPKALQRMAKGKPDGTKIVAGVRVARNADGTPRILSKGAIDAISRKRNDLLKQAIDTAPEDGTPNRLKDTGNGNYRGVMSPSQLIAISQIPDIVLPPRMKVLIRKINEMLLRNDGSRFNTEYQAALRGGGYRAMAPRFSDDVPIGFQFSKDGNFLVTTVSVTRLNNKLNAWAKEMPGRLALWNGSKYDFWADFVKVLDNQKKNIAGETDLDGDPQVALEKKNVINDLLNLYNKETELLNPSRTKLKQKRGQDSRDRTIVSRRLDRMLRLDENNAEKLPINYGKVIANALPQEEFDFTDADPATQKFYQDFEILNKKSGEYAGQPVRISVEANTAEEAEQMIRNTPEYQRYNNAYRFNSIGKPYSRPEESDRPTPEDFLKIKTSLGTAAKALPAAVYGEFYHGTNNPENLLEQPEDFFEQKFYGRFDPIEVIYVAPDKNDATKFGNSVLKTKLKSSNIFDPGSDEDLKKFKDSALAFIDERYESFDDLPIKELSYLVNPDGSPMDSPDWRNKLADAYANEIAKRRYDKSGSWIFTEINADIIKDAGFDGYIAWEYGNPQIGFFPDRTGYEFKLDKSGFPAKKSGKVDFAKALPDISNPDDVRNEVSSIFGRQFGYPEIKDWFVKSYLKNFIKSSIEDAESRADLEDYRFVAGDPEYKKNMKNFLGFKDSEKSWLAHVIDWTNSISQTDRDKLYKQPYSEINRKVFEWSESMAKKSEKAEKEKIKYKDEGKDFKTLVGLQDGYSAVELLSPEAYSEEGERMGHCVGSYCRPGTKNNKFLKIYSIRDQNKIPRATIEVINDLNKYIEEELKIRWKENSSEFSKKEYDENFRDEITQDIFGGIDPYEYDDSDKSAVVFQIKGKANEAVSEKYAPYVREFLKSKIGSKFAIYADGENIGLVKRDPTARPSEYSKYYSGDVYVFPDELGAISSSSKALPKDLSQVTLDERKAKLPKVKFETTLNEDGSETAIVYAENGEEAGQAKFITDIDAGIQVLGTLINGKYRGKGYGEQLYRELAKQAQMTDSGLLVGDSVTEAAAKVRNKLFEQESDDFAWVESGDPMISRVNRTTKYLPKDLSQVTLDERKAKLPKVNFYAPRTTPFGEIRMADEYGNPVGFAYYAIGEDVMPWATVGRQMRIDESYIDEEYRGKGYGEALYRELAKIAQENGVELLTSDGTSSDAAKVRKKLFEQVPTHGDLWTEDNDVMTSIVNPTTKYLPKSDQDFYSRLQQGIAASQQKTFSPEQAKSLAKKSTNQEELKWSGIEQAIDDIAKENNGKVPKQALMDYMDAAGNVQFEEIVLAEEKPESMSFVPLIAMEEELDSLLLKENLNDEEKARIRELKYAIRNAPKPENPKYGPKGMNKVLPGGRNYREVVMTMPIKTEDEIAELILKKAGLSLQAENLNRYAVDKNGVRVYSSDADSDLIKAGSRMATPEENAAIKAARAAKAPEIYTSSHFRNTPDYVAHYRTDERTDSEGKEGLFIEEIQSDRHQQGRKKGYSGDVKFKVITKDNHFEVVDIKNGENYNIIPKEFISEQAAKDAVADYIKRSPDQAWAFYREGIPDAPFRKDWPLQMFKRALRDAVADGKDWIGWTDGATQADRYDLSRQVDAIKVYSDQEADKYSIWAKEKGSNNLRKIAANVSANEMANYIGKDLAEKAAKDVASRKGYSPEYSGLDLKVGGEGMKGFYDTMLPKEVGRYVDKMGGKVEQSALRIGEEYPDPVFDIPEGIQDEIAYKAEQRVRRANPALDDESSDFRDAVQELQYNLSEDWAKENGAKDYKIWRINITPQMRETVLKQGQPKFLPKAEQQQQEVRAPKERGLQFLKYAEEEEERPAPLSSLMLN